MQLEGIIFLMILVTLLIVLSGKYNYHCAHVLLLLLSHGVMQKRTLGILQLIIKIFNLSALILGNSETLAQTAVEAKEIQKVASTCY